MSECGDFEQRLEATLERLFAPILEQAKRRMEMPTQECFSIEQTAALTGLSAKHIRRAVKRGDLPCSNVGGKLRPTLRISRRDIDAWLESHRVKRAPAKAERDAQVERYFGKSKRRKSPAA